MKYWLFIIACNIITGLYAQETDTIRNRHLYKPDRVDTVVNVENIDTARAQFIRDSIMAREIFIRDSLLAREQFVRDSLIRRKKILDSLNILKPQLERLLDAYIKSVREEMILSCREIPIIGDSALGDFIFNTLPFGVKDPFTPWKVRLDLSDKALLLGIDRNTNKINSIHTSQFKASFAENADRNLLIIHHPVVIQRNTRGNYYKIPVDSVFYERSGRIGKIKSYVLFYNLTGDNQKGQLLFTNATLVKQYRYNPSGTPMTIQLVRFCERWKSYETNKVCSIINYTFSRNENKIILVRKNDPANTYSDGTYTFTLADNDDLSAVSFINAANTESWERTIELNKEGNVNCYFDKSNGLIVRSLCMIYHPEPDSKFPVETITTTFEKDGISYLQKNNTTGKIRTRDRMTLEWSPWK